MVRAVPFGALSQKNPDTYGSFFTLSSWLSFPSTYSPPPKPSPSDLTQSEISAHQDELRQKPTPPDPAITEKGFIVPPNKYIRNASPQPPKSWVPVITKDGGKWTYEVRTAEPHNPAGGPGRHIATCNPLAEARGENNVHLLAASPSLHAYAKAEELRERWWQCVASFGMGSSQSLDANRVFEAHITTMGWRSPVCPKYFLATYRAAALDLAKGTTTP